MHIKGQNVFEASIYWYIIQLLHFMLCAQSGVACVHDIKYAFHIRYRQYQEREIGREILLMLIIMIFDICSSGLSYNHVTMGNYVMYQPRKYNQSCTIMIKQDLHVNTRLQNSIPITCCLSHVLHWCRCFLTINAGISPLKVMLLLIQNAFYLLFSIS